MPQSAVAPSSSSQRSLKNFVSSPRISRALKTISTVWNHANISGHGKYLASPPRTYRVLKMISALWKYTKISRLGEYSAERVESLESYCQHTPVARVVFVTMLIPVPSLLWSLLVECIHLQDPAGGWKINVGAYLRFCCIVSSGALGSIMQLRTVIKIHNLATILIVLGTGCGSVAMMILIASLWVFPIPLGINVLALPAVILFVLLFLLLAKHQTTRTRPDPSTTLKQPLYLIAAQAIIAIIYTFFSVIFERCSSAQRFALLLLLPMMKIILKHLVAHMMTSNRDSIPAAVVFTVDVFNSLYSSICIQTSGSWLSLFLIIGLNAVQTIFSTAEINRAAKYFCLLNRRRTAIIQATRVEVSSIRASITGRNTARLLHRDQSTATSLSSSHEAHKRKMSAKILFLLEYQALVGYTQAFIPWIYAIYLTALVHMPSSKYYPHTRSLTSEQLQKRIASIAAYSATQMLSLAWLHFVVKRKLGFSLMFQLAFVLKTEVEQLQGRLFVWIILVLQISLVHFGMDFSFEFKWINQ